MLARDSNHPGISLCLIAAVGGARVCRTVQANEDGVVDSEEGKQEGVVESLTYLMRTFVR